MSEIKGLQEAKRKMQARSRLFKSASGPYAKAGKLLAKSTSANFNAEGRPHWQARVGNYSHPILNRTGKMRDKAESNALGSWQISGNIHILQIHSPHSNKGFPYGVMHQIYGIPTRGKRIVRKFVRLYGPEWNDMRMIFRKVFLQ